MIIHSAEFLRSGLKEIHFPQTLLPEIAFAGRSNVGKSTLINALMGRKALVRTSRKPGQTRTLNFFMVNKTMVMVDLPGYGFSQAPKEVIRTYQEATISYLKKRKTLVSVVLLLDVRRLPSKEDKQFLDLVRASGRDLLIILTKSDTLGRGSWKGAWSAISKDLDDPGEDPIFFSARTGQGKSELWKAIEERLPKAT